MRTGIPLLALACALLMVGSPHPVWGAGARGSADPLARLDRNPYDYAARRELVEQCLAAGEHASAYYHAAWLYWLAPKEHAEAGFAYLADRRLRDRARAAGPEGAVSIVVGAVTARQRLVDTCLRGTIATQTSFLQREVSQLLAEAERNARVLAKGDPVVRAALADLSLTVDDALRFEGGSRSRRERLKVLRRAAGLAESGVAQLPESPGAHRLLGLVHARRAEMDAQPELWDSAITEFEAAWRLDPNNILLPETLRVLSLRTGRWDEARGWQATAAMIGEGKCGGDDTNPDAPRGEQAGAEE